MTTTTATSWGSNENEHSRFVPEFFFPKNTEIQTWKAGVLGALNFAAQVLAVRLILLIAVVGAIVLSWSSLSDPQVFRVVALSVYGLLVVLPVVWLAASGRG